jgi:undecaprenyl-diphosphatase
LVAKLDTPLFDRLFPALSRLADHAKLWIAIGAGLTRFGGRFGQRAALRGLGALTLTSVLVNLGLKPIFRRTRPALEGVPQARRLKRLPKSASLPSGHSASAWAFTTGVSMEMPVLAPVLLPLAAAVSFSRVYTGVHYPSDVAAGGVVGFSVALLSRVAWPVAPKPVGRAALAPAERVSLPRSQDGGGLTLIVNRDAGAVFRGAPLDALKRLLARARVVEVGKADDLVAVCRRAAEDCEALGICGGDSSVRIATEAALERDRPLLLVPGGTLNHLAHDLGIQSADDALAAFASGDGVEIDVARIDGRSFLNAAALGIYTQVLDARKLLEPRLGRWPAHVVALAKVLVEARHTELELDGARRRLWMLFIGNCRHHDRGVAPGRRQRLDDGILDLRIVDAARRWSRLRLLLALTSGRLDQSRVYERREARELLLSSYADQLRIMLDGEAFDAGGALTVAKRPERLAVYAPRRSDDPFC